MARNKNKNNSLARAVNESRRNGKAWKKRPCGQRHAPTPCARCTVRKHA